MDAEFHNSSAVLSSFAVSVFVLGFSVLIPKHYHFKLLGYFFFLQNWCANTVIVYQVGPLLLSPLSEIYGRQPILNIANIFFSVWQIGCALAPNINALIAFRFFAGVGGSACLTIGGGIIADLFVIEQRGLATAMFSIGPLFGPVIGPIIGGFIAQRAGWRWVYWVLLCATSTVTIGNIILNSETNHVVLMQRKTAKLRKELDRPELQSVYDVDSKVKKPLDVLIQGIFRPLRILFRSPILLFLAIYFAFVFGCMYLLFTTLSTLYIEVYHWEVELCGLAYIGLGMSFCVGVVVVARTSDATVVRLTKANNNVYEPEMRLASSVIFALFIPISFFWYGWTSDKHVHWVVPIIALIPFGFGMMGIFLPVQTYFIDAGGRYAASAIAGLTAFRCLFGAFLPLAGPSMYSTLGLGWGNSLLGFVALSLVPVPAVIYKYGSRFRQKHPINLD
jgi:multidrug resistance protein